MFHIRILTLTDFRGCVTPQQIENVNSEIDNDVMDLDGYEELPKETQEKVARAFKQGHVDDEDWQGVRDSFSFFLCPQITLQKGSFLNVIPSTVY